MTTASHAEQDVSADQALPPNVGDLIDPAARTGNWPRIAVAWRAAVNYLVPLGHQDETGFHYGEARVSETAASPGGIVGCRIVAGGQTR